VHIGASGTASDARFAVQTVDIRRLRNRIAWQESAPYPCLIKDENYIWPAVCVRTAKNTGSGCNGNILAARHLGSLQVTRTPFVHSHFSQSIIQTETGISTCLPRFH